MAGLPIEEIYIPDLVSYRHVLPTTHYLRIL